MAAVPQPDFVPVEDYLEGEKTSEIKHHYVRGQVFAMSGVSGTHGRLTGELAYQLKHHTRGGPCELFVADMKVRVSEDIYYYPDLLVTCTPGDPPPDGYFVTQPKVIVEVLSKSTEAFDRGDKFADYRGIASLDEYVLVSTTQQRVEVFRRRSGGVFELHSAGPGQSVRLESLTLDIEIDALYEGIELIPVER